MVDNELRLYGRGSSTSRPFSIHAILNKNKTSSIEDPNRSKIEEQIGNEK